jgi:hypothetical protein
MNQRFSFRRRCLRRPAELRQEPADVSLSCRGAHVELESLAKQ